MKRAWIILIGGLALAALAYAGTYRMCCGPYRHLAAAREPELAWLQKEFNIPDADFARVVQLHETYSAGCAERCARIDAKNAELKNLLAATNAVTPQIEKALQEAAQIRSECQQAMLRHFYEVSQAMPPEQGRRYFAWVVDRTLGPGQHSTMTFNPRAGDHEPHGQ